LLIFTCSALVQLFVTFQTDDDKDLEKLLTGYEDMVGFLHVHKVAQINSQVLYCTDEILPHVLFFLSALHGTASNLLVIASSIQML